MRMQGYWVRVRRVSLESGLDHLYITPFNGSGGSGAPRWQYTGELSASLARNYYAELQFPESSFNVYALRTSTHTSTRTGIALHSRRTLVTDESVTDYGFELAFSPFSARSAARMSTRHCTRSSCSLYCSHSSMHTTYYILYCTLIARRRRRLVDRGAGVQTAPAAAAQLDALVRRARGGHDALERAMRAQVVAHPERTARRRRAR